MAAREGPVGRGAGPVRVAMIAYSHYETDPRVRREAEALARAGYSVDVAALRRAGQPPQERWDGIELFRLDQDRYRGESARRYIGSYLAFLLRAAWWLTGRRDGRGVQLVHVNTMPDFLAAAGLWHRLVRRVPLILDIHDTMPEIYAAKFHRSPDAWAIRLLRWQEVLSAHLASAVLTSEPTKAELLVRHGVPPDKITVLLNLPDPAIFGPPDRPPAPEDATCFRLVYHGMLARRLGVDIALRGLGEVRQEMDALGPWRFEIYGEGNDRPLLQALRAELGLGERARFSDGPVPVSEIPGLLRGAALGLVPTRDQVDTAYMLPTKLLEYVHLGIPALVRRTLTVGRCFRDDQVAFLESDDPAVWGAAILALRRDEARRRRLAEAARQFARENRWEAHQKVYVDLVGSLVSRRWPGLRLTGPMA